MADDSNDIADLFQDYADAMNDMDAEGIAALFAYPVTIWQLGRGYVFATPEELEENIETLLGVFEDAGVVYSEAAIGPTHVTAYAAFATASWRQQDEIGDVVHAFHCAYTLVKQDGDWLITTIVNDDAAEDL
ncbi:MAG: nuclear transport factor 2 family protein [Rhizobiales bacterium]|nr:nuclear transport factor 2 family protein [Hyphomicrobiales bacterium]